MHQVASCSITVYMSYLKHASEDERNGTTVDGELALLVDH